MLYLFRDAGAYSLFSGDPQADLVRHFLIEPTPKGVRLRGCSNEPVFGKTEFLGGFFFPQFHFHLLY